MRTSAQGPFDRSSSFVVVSSWKWAAVFVVSAGMVMIGTGTTALAQRAELAEPEFEERANPATRHSTGAHTIRARDEAAGEVQFHPFDCGLQSPEEVRSAFRQAVQRGEVVDPTKRVRPKGLPRALRADPPPCTTTPTSADIFPFEDSAGLLLTNFSDGALFDLMTQGANAVIAANQDNFDFIGFWVNFVPHHTLGAAFYLFVFNDVSGIGLGAFDNRAFFGLASTEVEGYVMMWNVNSWQPGTGASADFTRLVLGQEFEHRFAMFLPNLADGRQLQGDNRAPCPPCPCGRSAHWNRKVDGQGSGMEIAEWVGSSPATRISGSIDFNTDILNGVFSYTDLYLMGYVSGAEMDAGNSELRYMDMAAADPCSSPYNGAISTFSSADIIATAGVRSPSSASAQKHFKTAWIMIHQPGDPPDATELTRAAGIMAQHTIDWNVGTVGRGTMCNTLRKDGPPPGGDCLTQLPDQVDGFFSDVDCDFCGAPPNNIQIEAENFQLNAGDQIDFIRFWGGYFPDDIPQNPDCFMVIFREDDGGGLPGAEINRFVDCVPATTRVLTGNVLFGVDEYEYTIEIEPNKVLGAGTFWVEIYNDTFGNTDSWFWETGTLDSVNGIAGSAFTPTLPEPPWFPDAVNLALELVCKGPRPVKWSQPPIGEGENIPSNIDWDDLDPSVVVADDFVSDGRPVKAVRWWGSKLGEAPPCTEPTDDCDLKCTVNEGVFPYDNIGATDDGPPPLCGALGSDVWFNYQATCDGTATIDTCGASYDTVLEVFDGCVCSPIGAFITCNDDDFSGQCAFVLDSFVSFPVSAGQCYKVRIGGFSGDQGTGTLTIDCTPCPGGGACTVANGGFETGDLCNWTATSNGFGEFFPWTVGPGGTGTGFHFSSPLSGGFDAVNGFDGDAGLVYELYQDVSLPAGATITLTTNHRIQYDSLGIFSTLPRELDISIRDTGNVVLSALFHQDVLINGAPNTDLGWNTQVFDISGFAGQTVRIHFEEFIPESFTGPALIEFDDISLTCTTLGLTDSSTGRAEAEDRVIRQVISLHPPARATVPSFEELQANYLAIRERARHERTREGGAVRVLLDPPPLPWGGSGVEVEFPGEPSVEYGAATTRVTEVNVDQLDEAGNVQSSGEPDGIAAAAAAPCVVINSFPTPASAQFAGLAWDGQFLWAVTATAVGATQNALFKMNGNTGAILDTIPYNVAQIPAASGLAWDGTHFRVSDVSNDRIYRVATDGTVVDSVPSPTGSVVGLTFDGTFLWSTDFNSATMDKFNASTGAPVASFGHPDTRPAGMAWDGNSLWTNGRDSALTYDVNPTDGSVLSSCDTPPGPGTNNGQGAAASSQFVWVANFESRTIFQIEGPTPPPTTPDPDGWFISFHEMPLGVDSQRPPLALYFCDADVVNSTDTGLPACDSHPVIEYLADLSDCCLVHANPDSRSILPVLPATKEAFFEERCFDYAIDIQAVIGHEFFQDPDTLECIETPTGNSAAGDFWGWHTTSFLCGKPPFGPSPALQSSIKMDPEGEWLYGPWNPIVPVCSQPHMAFELLTNTPGGGDDNGNCVPDQCECLDSSPPVLESSKSPSNRYISIKAGDPGLSQAIRVRYVDLPAPFDVWNFASLGIDFFVGEPFQVCENGGEVLFSCDAGFCSNPPNNACSTDVDCCGAVGPLPRKWFWAAQLVCEKSAAHFMDWHGECVGGICVGGLLEGDTCSVDADCQDAVSLHSEGLIPEGVYSVQVIDSSPACDLNDDASYSAPLPVTQGVWGDLCSNGPGGACTGPPDGNPEVIQDVLGLIDKFQNINALQKSMTDLSPGDDGEHNGPDFKVTIIGDTLFALDAFQGFPYPFTPGDPCP